MVNVQDEEEWTDDGKSRDTATKWEGLRVAYWLEALTEKDLKDQQRDRRQGNNELEYFAVCFITSGQAVMHQIEAY